MVAKSSLCTTSTYPRTKNSKGRRSGVSVVDPAWKREFEDPIPLPLGWQLVALEDAARYIQELPEAEHERPDWQAAVEARRCLLALA
jgi:hypothetical protein